jgi:hypothetical protein
MQYGEAELCFDILKIKKEQDVYGAIVMTRMMSRCCL